MLSEHGAFRSHGKLNINYVLKIKKNNNFCCFFIIRLTLLTTQWKHINNENALLYSIKISIHKKSAFLFLFHILSNKEYSFKIKKNLLSNIDALHLCS